VSSYGRFDVSDGDIRKLAVKPVEVLLVEDNPGDILLIRQALGNQAWPINVRVATDGKQAAQLLAARHFDPDLVILDLNVPKLSGLSVLECSQREIPIVVFTSSVDPLDRRCSFELGAKEFVQKPAELAAYTQAVSRIARNWAIPKADSGAKAS
ncbi:MAG TPA: response regulator, partial [Bryobacteraceae bacterium]|nr:response regulator [Bryobacteraceae bacterium]